MAERDVMFLPLGTKVLANSHICPACIYENVKTIVAVAMPSKHITVHVRACQSPLAEWCACLGLARHMQLQALPPEKTHLWFVSQEIVHSKSHPSTAIT